MGGESSSYAYIKLAFLHANAMLKDYLPATVPLPKSGTIVLLWLGSAINKRVNGFLNLIFILQPKVSIRSIANRSRRSLKSTLTPERMLKEPENRAIRRSGILTKRKNILTPNGKKTGFGSLSMAKFS